MTMIIINCHKKALLDVLLSHISLVNLLLECFLLNCSTDLLLEYILRLTWPILSVNCIVESKCNHKDLHTIHLSEHDQYGWSCSAGGRWIQKQGPIDRGVGHRKPNAWYHDVTMLYLAILMNAMHCCQIVLLHLWHFTNYFICQYLLDIHLICSSQSCLCLSCALI